MIQLLLLTQGLWAAPVPSPCLGLDSYPAGSTWTYAGRRLWSQANARADSGAVTWTTTVVRTRTVPMGHLLLVRGFVSELAWSTPGTLPRLSILACLSHRLLHLEFSTDSSARHALDHWADSLLDRATLILQEPLRDGAVFGQVPPRDDPMYGWAVEKVDSVSALPPGCRASGPEAYRLTMRTLPDQQVFEWRAGVGVMAYQIEHHGTPAAVAVHLVRCHRG
jgi:hypothetical protein